MMVGMEYLWFIAPLVLFALGVYQLRAANHSGQSQINPHREKPLIEGLEQLNSELSASQSKESALPSEAVVRDDLPK